MTTKFVADRIREIDANRQFLRNQIAELVAENRRLKAENSELKQVRVPARWTGKAA